MIRFLRKLANRLSLGHQQELKRIHFARQIRKGLFRSTEPEFDRLREWVKTGDWVLDIGANVGHYTVQLSEIVGAEGRVISFEPVSATFELLAANSGMTSHDNVTLLNIALSDKSDLIGMAIPKSSSGYKNYYRAYVTGKDKEFSVMCFSLDSMSMPKQIKLIKIDVEGHELDLLKGMRTSIERDHPRLIIEGQASNVSLFLLAMGYQYEDAAESPNRVFHYKKKDQSQD